MPIEDIKQYLRLSQFSSDGGKRWKSSGVRNSLMAYNNEESIGKVLRKNGFTKVSFYAEHLTEESGTIFRKPFKVLESDWLNVVAVK